MADNEGDVPLTHDELWDDSALVDSWNSALDEYKKYHSIHLKGGNVNDLLTADKSKPQEATSHEADGPTLETSTPGAVQDATSRPETTSAAQPRQGAPSAPPPAMLGSMRDEGLKRLLMSWYYAGYYTGFYEGQQDQAPPSQPDSEKR